MLRGELVLAERALHGLDLEALGCEDLVRRSAWMFSSRRTLI